MPAAARVIVIGAADAVAAAAAGLWEELGVVKFSGGSLIKVTISTRVSSVLVSRLLGRPITLTVGARAGKSMQSELTQSSSRDERDDISFLRSTQSREVSRTEFVNHVSWKCMFVSALVVACVSFLSLQRPSSAIAWPEQNVEWKRGKYLLRSLQFDTLSFSADDLCHLTLEMFQELDLGLEERKLKNLILAVRESMHPNPYHNWFHVVDVTQMIFSLMHKTSLLERMDKIQKFALIVSALCHDLDHPGVSNSFLISSRSELALLYNDRSPLENHHSSQTFRLLHRADINLLKNMTVSEYQEFRKAVIGNILATDMGRHSEYASKLEIVATSQQGADVQFQMEVTLKYADISSVWRPFNIAKQWAMRVTNEFFLQGDEERRKGLVITANMDRTSSSRVSVQMGFIDYIVTPYSRNMVRLMPPLLESEQQLLHNRADWGKINDSDLEAFCRRADVDC